MLSYPTLCAASPPCFDVVIRPRAHAGSLVKGTALGECASNKETKGKNKLEANRASDYFPITVGWSHDAATTTRRLALSALPTAYCLLPIALFILFEIANKRLAADVNILSPVPDFRQTILLILQTHRRASPLSRHRGTLDDYCECDKTRRIAHQHIHIPNFRS